MTRRYGASALVSTDVITAEVTSSSPGKYSRVSPGRQSNSWQIAASVEKRAALALPVFRIETWAP
jgi:hypothetical protein